MAKETYKHPLNLDEYVQYKYGVDSDNKPLSIELHAPAIAEKSEADFVSANLGAAGEDETKDTPTMFVGLKRAGRETHLKAAYKMAKEKAAELAPQQPTEESAEKEATKSRRNSA